MTAQTDEPPEENRVKLSFELDASTAESIRTMARLEHRTLSAQLRVICEDAVAERFFSEGQS